MHVDNVSPTDTYMSPTMANTCHQKCYYLVVLNPRALTDNERFFHVETVGLPRVL